jgi:uncharacterized membrane protein YbhN (UPF0104 family)
VVPAVLATAVILIVLSMLSVYEPVERSIRRRAGLTAALDMVKRREPLLLGALANWGFDIGVVWASFHAFGQSPPGAVLVMAYYVGTLANVLPFPGGIGGVEGGMIGAFLAFGAQAHLTLLAVLA